MWQYQELGIGQSWQVVTSSRSFNTLYSNTTNKPITVFFTGYTTQTWAAFYSVVNGVTIGICEGAGGYYVASMNFIVPAGTTYKVTWTSGGDTPTIYLWAELR